MYEKEELHPWRFEPEISKSVSLWTPLRKVFSFLSRGSNIVYEKVGKYSLFLSRYSNSVGESLKIIFPSGECRRILFPCRDSNIVY